MLRYPEIIICGGGHVSVELAYLADFLDYAVTVIDDRVEFAQRQRFPMAKRVICQNFETALVAENFPENSYYVIVTRGHENDLGCAQKILKLPYGYIGMIGSRTKVGKTRNYLKEQGYSEQKINDIHAPIGLPIGGETPKEIAVSIMAEIIQHKNKIPESNYIHRDEEKMLVEKTEKIVRAEIVTKTGSAPRGTGTRMYIFENGKLFSTIGGGKIEYQVIQDALSMFKTGQMERKKYSLTQDGAASMGMWCGGEIEVEFQLV